MGELPRILMVTNEDPGYPLGGLGEFIARLSQELKLLGYGVKILFISYQPINRVSSLVDYSVECGENDGHPVPEIATLQSSYTILCRTIPILLEYQPHIIHCNDRQAYWPFRGMKNVVFSLHLCYPDLISKILGLGQISEELYQEFHIDKHALKNAPITLVYSQFMARRVRDFLCPHSRNIILPLGSRNFPLEDTIKPRNKPKVVSFFGRLDQAQKGIMDFIHGALGFLDRHSREMEFRIYGPGNLNSNVLKQKNIFYHGLVQGKDKVRAYFETDIVVMPSKYEPFGIVGIEAMASGCLLLAPKGLGMDEFFIPGRNGLKIESNKESIIQVLHKAIQNWEDCKALVTRGIGDAQHWNWKKSAEIHGFVFQACTQGHHRSLLKVGDPRQAKQLKFSRWSAKNRKPGLTEVVLQSLHRLTDSLTCSLVLWNPDITEEIYCGTRNNTSVQKSWEKPYLCLENSVLFVPYFSCFVCIGGLEFAIDGLAAVELWNIRGPKHIVSGLYTGEPVAHQIMQFDDSEELATILSNYSIQRTIVLQNYTLSLWMRESTDVA